MTGPRDLRDILGEDVPATELDYLRRAHEALQASDAPPEVPVSLTARVLAIPERPSARFDRRRALTGLAIAAAIAGAAFGIGFWAGGGASGPPIAEVITLAPTERAPRTALMTINVLPRDAAGNWAMTADVTDLPTLPEGAYYEVWLTKGEKTVASCGRFVVDAGGEASNVWLNAPYPLKGYERWVVTAEVPGRQRSGWLLDGPVVVPA